LVGQLARRRLVLALDPAEKAAAPPLELVE
jgi:hypothetical protein